MPGFLPEVAFLVHEEYLVFAVNKVFGGFPVGFIDFCGYVFPVNFKFYVFCTFFGESIGCKKTR